MTVLAEVFYGILLAVGVLDLALVTPALRAARTGQTVERLLSTLLVLAGLVVLSGVRLSDLPPTKNLAVIALGVIDMGLIGYAMSLNERVRRRIHRLATRRKGRGSAR